MATLTILRYPDERLHKVAKPVAVIDDRITQLVRDMFDTMYAAEGIGLAATQVNVHKRVVVVDVSEAGDSPLVLINPEITWASKEKATGEEGCLSVPGISEAVERAVDITVRALDLQGKPFTLEAGEWLAVCIQHEIDHLNGKVFVEYLPLQKRNRIKSRMRAGV